MLGPVTLLIVFANAYVALLGLVLFILALVGKRRERTAAVDGGLTVSVIVPVRDEPEDVLLRLAETLRSIALDARVSEVIVVDDSGERGFKALKRALAGVPKLVIVHRTSPRGFKPGALNDALALSKGDVVLVLDADTALNSDVLGRMLSQLRSGYGYVQCKTVAEGRGLAAKAYLAFEVFRNEVLLPSTQALGTPLIAGYGYAIRREVLRRVGGWREDVLAEDWDLTVRLAATGVKGVYLDDEVKDLPPATFRGLRRQQERWLYGSLQVLKNALSPNLKLGLTKRVCYALPLSLFLSLAFNVLAALAPLLALCLGVPVEGRLLALMGTLVNACWLPASLMYVRRIVDKLGIAGAVSALVAGGMLYATLSPKALIAAIRVLLGRRKGWVRTPKGRGRSGEGIDSYYALPIALYSVGAAASAVAAKALLPWNVALLAGTVLSLALEVKEEKG